MRLDGLIKNFSAHRFAAKAPNDAAKHTQLAHPRPPSDTRRWLWSNPLPQECSRSCVLFMIVCRQRLDYWVPPSRRKILPPPRPHPLRSCLATPPRSYPTDTCWLRRRASTVAASRTTPVDCPHEHDGYDPSYIMEFRMLARGSCIRCKGIVWPDVSRHNLP